MFTGKTALGGSRLTSRRPPGHGDNHRVIVIDELLRFDPELLPRVQPFREKSAHPSSPR
jgi:hypothetical protein